MNILVFLCKIEKMKIFFLLIDDILVCLFSFVPSLILELRVTYNKANLYASVVQYMAHISSLIYIIIVISLFTSILDTFKSSIDS